MKLLTVLGGYQGQALATASSHQPLPCPSEAPYTPPPLAPPLVCTQLHLLHPELRCILSRASREPPGPGVALPSSWQGIGHTHQHSQHRREKRSLKIHLLTRSDLMLGEQGQGSRLKSKSSQREPLAPTTVIREDSSIRQAPCSHSALLEIRNPGLLRG